MIALAEQQNVRLTTKQALFVDRYVLSLNGAKAAREAGYSEKIARNQAAENMAKPHIRAAIEAKLRALKPDLHLTPEKLRARVSKIVLDDTLRPDTQLKAIELAGKMTPGTFEPAPPTTQINFFSVLSKLNSMSPEQLAAIRVSSNHSTPITQHTPKRITQHTTIDAGVKLDNVAIAPAQASPAQCDVVPPGTLAGDTAHNSTASEQTTQAGALEPVDTPPATLVDRDTVTPKNVVQNQPSPHLLHSEEDNPDTDIPWGAT